MDNKTITVQELRDLRADLENNLKTYIQENVNKFLTETGVGIKNISIVFTDVSELGNSTRKVLTGLNISIEL